LPKIASELGIEDKVYFDLNHLSEDEMSWLYSNASLFVSPSLMEGFGATPIEAITHNTPVLVSNIDTLKEVVRDCATFFDPSNVTDLVENLTESINNQISQAELDKRKQFMLDVYSRKSQVMNYLNFLTSLN
jgi:glycosyltransferase involved in cell wall biosynthesis